MKLKNMILLLAVFSAGILSAEEETETTDKPLENNTPSIAKTMKKVYRSPFITGYQDEKKTQPNCCKTKEELFKQLQKNGLKDEIGKYQNVSYQYTQNGNSVLTVTGTPEQIQKLDQSIANTFKEAQYPIPAKTQAQSEKKVNKTEKKLSKSEKKKAKQKKSKAKAKAKADKK